MAGRFDMAAIVTWLRALTEAHRPWLKGEGGDSVTF
ncbi:hypothetical protein HGR_01497 [Hylemonella gracilis ATCC 19624]|uniref:Uncharacterized protein n=1 Tax=Hylemonella gracilis ATCC 19624 TaxID=887062 RepID=F3KPE2_9BURK|nr:hypothetical protein HGR_01497 [Hylemonella gracilis ATCC 19624]